MTQWRNECRATPRSDEQDAAGSWRDAGLPLRAAIRTQRRIGNALISLGRSRWERALALASVDVGNYTDDAHGTTPL